MQDYALEIAAARCRCGGLSGDDTRLGPASAPENTAPELAYPAVYRLAVDPVRRRVYVRRGHVGVGYPGTFL